MSASPFISWGRFVGMKSNCFFVIRWSRQNKCFILHQLVTWLQGEVNREAWPVWKVKWYPNTAVSPNRTECLTEVHRTAPPTGLTHQWHINHDHFPPRPNRASFCCVSLTAAAHFNRQRFTISLSIIDSQPLLHWRSGVPQGSPLGTTCFSL